MSRLRTRSTQHRSAALTVLVAVMLAPLGVSTATAASGAGADNPPTAGQHKGKKIKDQYIVTFDKSATTTEVDAAREKARGRGGKVHYNYKKAVKGFSATLSAEAVAELQKNPRVLRGRAGLRGARQRRRHPDARDVGPGPHRPGRPAAEQHLHLQRDRRRRHRVRRSTPASAPPTPSSAAASAPGSPRSTTATARTTATGTAPTSPGTIGGSTYGVAKGVNLVPVRVLDCNGSGSNSGVIAGVDWVTANHGTAPAVANMSLGGSASTALDNADRQLDRLGRHLRGGGGQRERQRVQLLARPAARRDHGRAPTTNTDARSSFSNYGSCVDIFAPGSNITSSINTSDTATAVYSGTSMATPHVAGVIATYLQAVPTAAAGGRAQRPRRRGDQQGHRRRHRLAEQAALLRARHRRSRRRRRARRRPRPPVTARWRPPRRRHLRPRGQIGTSTVPVKVSRAAAADPDGVGSYELQQSTNGGTTWTTVVPSTTALSATLNLAAASSLRFRVRATDVPGTVGDYAQGADVRARPAPGDRHRGLLPRRVLVPDQSVTGASGGYVGSSTSTGAKVRLTFTGTQASWIGTMASNRGRAEVFVDGVSKGVVDQYASSHAGPSDPVRAPPSPRARTPSRCAPCTPSPPASSGYAVDDDAFVTVG